MADENETNKSQEQGNEGGQQGAGDNPQEQGGRAPQNPQESGQQDYFPRSYVEELRRENAGLRTKLRETEERLAGAKSQEDIDAAVNALKAENDELQRNLVAAQYNLPPELAKRLTGQTEEELKADAEALAQFITPKGDDDGEPPRTPRGGLNPGSRGDVVADASSIVESIRSKRNIF